MDLTERQLFAAGLERAMTHQRGADLDAELTQLGWRDALALDPAMAVSLLFEAQGFSHASSSAINQLLASVLRPNSTEDVAVVLPSLGTWQAPGALADGALVVHGIGTPSIGHAPSALVVTRVNDRHDVCMVAGADLSVRAVQGMDPQLELYEITGEEVPFGDHADIGANVWTAAVALGQLAMGHELVGASKKMLELAQHHALERVQFGQSISSFQAVRHRLADTLIAIETADAMLTSAWEDRRPESASMAKALAGRGAQTAARHCQQVLAGIGFTTEHELHHYVRRVVILDQLFGTAQRLTRETGDALLRTRTLTTLSPL